MDSAKLIKARHEKGWSQEELAERAGVSLRTIQRIEAEEVEPRHSTLRLLADNLQVSFSEFIEVEEKQSAAALRLSKFFEIAKIIALNFMVILVVNYLNFEAGANTNSRLGSWMMSVLLPFLLVFLMNESYTQRFYRYGLALLIDLLLAFLFVSDPFSAETFLPISVLLVSCFIYMPVLYYLGRAFENYKKTWMQA